MKSLEKKRRAGNGLCNRLSRDQSIFVFPLTVCKCAALVVGRRSKYAMFQTADVALSQLATIPSESAQA